MRERHFLAVVAGGLPFINQAPQTQPSLAQASTVGSSPRSYGASPYSQPPVTIDGVQPVSLRIDTHIPRPSLLPSLLPVASPVGDRNYQCVIIIYSNNQFIIYIIQFFINIINNIPLMLLMECY